MQVVSTTMALDPSTVYLIIECIRFMRPFGRGLDPCTFGSLEGKFFQFTEMNED